MDFLIIPPKCPFDSFHITPPEHIFFPEHRINANMFPKDPIQFEVVLGRKGKHMLEADSIQEEIASGSVFRVRVQEDNRILFEIGELSHATAPNQR